MAIKPKIEALISKSNAKTEKQDATLSEAVSRLIDGYGSGGEVLEDDSIYGFSLPHFHNLTFSTSYSILSLNNDAVQPICDIDYTKPWEIRLQFVPSYTGNRDMTLTGTYQTNYKNPSWQLKLAEGRLWSGYSTSGSSWDHQISVPLDASEFSSGGTYTALFGWDGETFYSKILDKTGKVMIAGEVAVTTPHHQNAAYPLSLGRNTSSSIFYAGDIDLSKSYIKNDGKIIWGHKTKKSLQLYQTSQKVLNFEKLVDPVTITDDELYSIQILTEAEA